MALTLQSALGGGRYSDISGHSYPELGGRSYPGLPDLGGGGRDSQELPIDLSRRRSPSPDVSITMGQNVLLDRAMGPPPEPLSAAPQDLRVVRPSHSIIPFHKLRRHTQKGPRARLKRQRLEEAVSLLREREVADENRTCGEESGTREDLMDRADVGEQSLPPPPPPPHQLMQQMLLMQQPDAVAYPSLLYLQYCAMMQSLQLQQALRRQQASKLPLSPSPVPAAAARRPGSACSASSTAATPPTTPATPGTPGTPEEPPQRRRAPRTLTGKHVRQGQGASPETLHALRRVILEKARLRDLGLLPPPKPKPKGRRRK